MKRKTHSSEGKMPPQAYTKQILASAVSWLCRQPESLKEAIKNSDDLIGHYLKAVRLNPHEAVPSFLHGGQNSSHSSLSSTKSFRNELQGLAQNLKQFEDRSDSNGSASEVQHSGVSQEEYLRELNKFIADSQMTRNPEVLTNGAITGPSPSNSHSLGESDELGKDSDTPAQESLGVETVLLKIDGKTREAIEISKHYFNLSSDTEAIRLLVTMGKNHLQDLFKDKGR